MLLQQIRLIKFRNYQDSVFKFNPFITVVIGRNSVGKTNLLEGIYFAYHGVGFREKKENQLIKFGANEARVDITLIEKEEKNLFQIILQMENSKTKKIFYVNRVKKTAYFYQKEIEGIVLFAPQQIEIISASPDVRRNYLDHILSFFHPNYKTALINYKNALRRRNKLLETVTGWQNLKLELKFWDNFLENEAKIITQIREEYINFLNKNNQIDNRSFLVQYQKNIFTQERVSQYFEKEIKVKQTLIGPQKDDFHIFSQDKDIHFFGSRSEQRLALFWLKINEINYFEKQLNKKPLLLLDDVFSEFDLENQKLILNLIKKHQTVLTTTDPLVFNFLNHPHSIIALS
jgi:DNA replication and repair protein RecF